MVIPYGKFIGFDSPYTPKCLLLKITIHPPISERQTSPIFIAPSGTDSCCSIPQLMMCFPAMMFLMVNVTQNVKPWYHGTNHGWNMAQSSSIWQKYVGLSWVCLKMIGIQVASETGMVRDGDLAPSSWMPPFWLQEWTNPVNCRIICFFPTMISRYFKKSSAVWSFQGWNYSSWRDFLVLIQTDKSTNWIWNGSFQAIQTHPLDRWNSSRLVGSRYPKTIELGSCWTQLCWVQTMAGWWF